MNVFLASVASIWIFVLFMDTIFKTCMFQPYYRFLYAAGLDIRPLIIKWRINLWNRLVNQMGMHNRVFLREWFNVGAYISCIVVFPSLVLYGATVISMFYTSTPEDFQSATIVPVFPGFNFPLAKWKLYISVILICSIAHELGHAIAASRERINIESCGIAFYIICPVAFVQLRLDQFNLLSNWRKMRICCAGVWHNIVLSLVALLSLKLLSPILLPLFCVGRGVSVLQVHEQSGLSGPSGIAHADHIYKIGNCTVKDLNSWIECLDESNIKTYGICIPINVVAELGGLNKLKECDESPNHFFFKETLQSRGICLSARYAVEGYDLCDKTDGCENNSLCLFPHLPDFHKFVVIQRYKKPAVIYEGPIDELKAAVEVSEFVARYEFLSPNIPESFKEFLAYVLMFSSGLACLNVLPIFTLDGTFITEYLIDMYLDNFLSYRQRKVLFNYISYVAHGTIICLAIVMGYKISLLYFTN